MEFTQDRLRKQIRELQARIDELEDISARREGAMTVMLLVGVGFGLLFGYFAAGAFKP
jgi:hypothetical protein